MKQVSFHDLMNWKDQSFQERKSRYEGKGCLNENNLAPYKIGFEDGFREAISILKLHADLEVHYKNSEGIPLEDN